MKKQLQTLFTSLFLSGLFLLVSPSAQAQLFVDGSYSPDVMVNDFFNTTCVTVSNVTWQADSAQVGFFEGATTNLGLNAGILLTSGTIQNTVGPNNNTGASVAVGSAGDTDLTTILGGSPYFTYDACVLEFDLVADEDMLIFEYVFGSEEYLEFVGSTFNDVFAFFVSGPGYDTTTNIALIPGTTTPVAINNVNDAINPDFYMDNPTDSPDLQYDGFTTPLTATMNVIPGETYHVKIAVADAGDQILDSGVFLSVESLCGGDLSPTAGFKVPNDLSGTTTVPFTNDSKYATAWNWDFGDGTTSTLRNPVPHTYAAPGVYTATLRVQNYFTTDTYTETLTVGLAVGTPDNALTQTQVYPNPVADVLHLQLPNALQATHLRLYNHAGQLLLTQPLNAATTGQVNMQPYPTGLYIAEIVTPTQVQQYKVYKR
ncbi:MAG TPA: choice-of-anchor L domain-containing protein [Chitinophagales bacterium]|nr:choice-of-anchor L domain-containing protein [Chitinophagales bacterium]